MPSIETQINAILCAIADIRVPAMPGEYDIHREIADALRMAGIPFSHEYQLAPRCRIDFLSDHIGIEVKKGRPTAAALQSQLTRYLQSDALDAVIVVVQRTVSLPKTIHQKPVVLISLNRLWGVALP